MAMMSKRDIIKAQWTKERRAETDNLNQKAQVFDDKRKKRKKTRKNRDQEAIANSTEE